MRLVRFSRTARRTGAGALTIVAVVAAVSLTDMPQPAPSRRPARGAAAACPAHPQPAAFLGLGGLRVARDPVTGELGLPPVEELQPSAALQEPVDPPRVEMLPGGMMLLYHDGHFLNYVTAKRGPDGRVITGCAPGADAARGAGAAAATPVARDAYGREVR